MVKRENQAAPPELHELEAEVMDEIWHHDEVTVRDVLEALNRGPKERAYTTIMTIMVRLEAKGLLTRERRGKTDVYRALMSREQYRETRARAEVDALVSSYGEVALAHFARQLGTIDAKRRQRLRRLVSGES